MGARSNKESVKEKPKNKEKETGDAAAADELPRTVIDAAPKKPRKPRQARPPKQVGPAEMTREALASALWQKALAGSVTAAEMLRKLGMLDEAASSAGAQVLLGLVDQLLGIPELCESERESFENEDGGSWSDDA